MRPRRDQRIPRHARLGARAGQVPWHRHARARPGPHLLRRGFHASRARCRASRHAAAAPKRRRPARRGDAARRDEGRSAAAARRAPRCGHGHGGRCGRARGDARCVEVAPAGRGRGQHAEPKLQLARLALPSAGRCEGGCARGWVPRPARARSRRAAHGGIAARRVLVRCAGLCSVVCAVAAPNLFATRRACASAQTREGARARACTVCERALGSSRVLAGRGQRHGRSGAGRAGLF
jgi:hypothetical protein